MLRYSAKHNLFYWSGPEAYEKRHLPRQAGFIWNQRFNKYTTKNRYIAHTLKSEADKNTRVVLAPLTKNVSASAHLGIGYKSSIGLYPFQASGVEHMSRQFKIGRKHLLCADQPGLGKSIEAIQTANELGCVKLLVICPGSLRLNWCSEIEKWALVPRVQPLLSGSDKIHPGISVVTSYELARHLKDFKPDFIIVDEAHYLKSYTAKRTQLILGNMLEKWPGLVSKAPTIFLTGTPMPNGKPTELFPLLKRCAPDTIDNMTHFAFIQRFCEWFDDGIEIAVTGVNKRFQNELYTRLRGSGFMTRRLKKQVLKDLPDKRYQMIIFPASGELKRILKEEENFNAEEIIRHGVPDGSGLPDIRRAMGVAKTPLCVEYISNLLVSGTEKLVVFCHHIEVANAIFAGLQKYKPVMVIGDTPVKHRHGYVKAFQNDPEVRVFIGNKAAEEGLTLTAACDVVMVEPEWVPGQNEQREDRIHRIGQTRGVIIHYLVVEQSLDARILAAAAKKADGIKQTIDR